MNGDCKRNSGRRAEDPKHNLAVDAINQPIEAPNRPLYTQDVKGLLQRLVWERAKGELNAMVAICKTEPTTERCAQIQVKVMDLIMGVEGILYKWKDK